MAKNLASYLVPPNLAVADGATAPDPGGTAARGAVIWSTTTSSLLRWSGTAWNAVAGAGGGISDGDKGDVVVSGSGSVWTVDNGAVSLAKLGASAVAAFAPIAHVGSGGDGGGDPDYAKVSLLLHCDGTNGSTTFTDNSSFAHVFTANGNAQISTAQSKFGGASGLFDGVGDYTSCASNAAFNLGTQDFCIEAQVYPTNASAGENIGGNLFQHIAGQWELLGGATNFSFFFGLRNMAPRGLLLSGGSFVGILQAPSALALNTWSHVAYVRSGSTCSLYVNGLLAASGSLSASVDVSTRLFTVGADAVGVGDFQGHLDEVRLTKGAPRYTADFTPPAAPFDDFGGTGHAAATPLLSGFMSAADKAKLDALPAVFFPQVRAAQQRRV